MLEKVVFETMDAQRAVPKNKTVRMQGGSLTPDPGTTLALLAEDRADFAAARDLLQRVVQRGNRAGVMRPLIRQVEERLAQVDNETRRVEAQLRSNLNGK